MRNFIARLCFSASVLLLSGTAVVSAQTSATPTPAAAPVAPAANPVKLSGNLRAFYFTRTNSAPCSVTLNKNQCNAAAFNLGGKIHGDYQFAKTPWSLGASFFGAEPFNGNGTSPGFNPRIDNSLPGNEIAVLGEGYLQYKNKYATGQIGREIINTPWANASDSRMTPSSFQGAWLAGNVSPTLTLAGYYMTRFRARTTSGFYNDTLLTSCHQQNPVLYYPGGVTQVLAGVDPCVAPSNTYVNRATRGFGMLQVTKKFNPTWVANAYYYNVADVVNIIHLDTKYNFIPKSSTNPYLAAQYIAESDTGRAQIGIVHAHMLGLQYGQSVGKNVDVAFSYNQSPQTLYTTTNCGGPTVASSTGVFGGTAGNAVAGAPAGTVYCYGGGIASPYTDSYATDPLFTTSISQGLADVHKPGSGLKAQFTFQTNNKRFKAIISGAQYYYGLPVAFPGAPAGNLANAVDNRKELNVDVQYFLNAVDPKKPYHGFSIRQRYVDRFQYFGGGATASSNGDFKYNRTQLEYTF